MKLEKLTTDELKQRYYAEFVHDNRLPGLFDLIPKKKLRQWLIDQLRNY